MQKILKILFVLTFVSFGAFAFTSLPKVDASVEKTVAVNAAVSAKELYARNCANCHGADGKGQTALGRSKDVPDLTDVKPSLKKSIRVITSGADDMPAFGKKLKKNEITALANYLRSL
jgi:mono/diheme cytochrome c family protein